MVVESRGLTTSSCVLYRRIALPYNISMESINASSISWSLSSAGANGNGVSFNVYRIAFNKFRNTVARPNMQEKDDCSLYKVLKLLQLHQIQADIQHIIALYSDNDWMVEKFLEICRDMQRAVRVDAVQLSSGRTPLHLALNKGHKKVAAALLRAGVNLNLVDANGYQALHIISSRKVDDNLLETILQIIDDIGQTVEVDAKDKKDRTPLHLALSNGNNPNLTDDKGYTSLHYIASRKIDDDLTDWFLAICHDVPREVELKAGNESGNTPLRLAKRYALKNVAKSLLRRGATKRRSGR